MSDPQPEYVWAQSDEKPKRGRAWLIVLLAVVAVVIAAFVFWLFLRPGAPLAQPTPTWTSSSTPSATSTSTPTQTPTDSSTPEATPTPIDTPPPPPDPSIAVFRGQVSGWLDDALTGLDIVSESSGQDSLAVIDNLRGDAQRLAETPAPSSIASDWSDDASRYGESLTELRKAVSSGSAASVDAARSSVQNLRELVGL